MVEIDNPTDAASLGPVNGYSTSNSTALSEQFPASPINGDPNISNTNNLTDVSVSLKFTKEVMRGDVPESTSYWGFPVPYSRDYKGAPSYDFGLGDTYVYQAGDPFSSFVPNLNSAPNADPYTQPAPNDEQKEDANSPAKIGSSPFVGEGTNVSPHDGAQRIVNPFHPGTPGWSLQENYQDHEAPPDVLGTYLKGKSGMTLEPTSPPEVG